MVFFQSYVLHFIGSRYPAVGQVFFPPPPETPPPPALDPPPLLRQRRADLILLTRDYFFAGSRVLRREFPPCKAGIRRDCNSESSG